MSDRLPCCVPFCRRSTGRPVGEWICPDHWRPVPRRLKWILTRVKRRQSQVAVDTVWRQVKGVAIEIAAGIRR